VCVSPNTSFVRSGSMLPCSVSWGVLSILQLSLCRSKCARHKRDFTRLSDNLTWGSHLCGCGIVCSLYVQVYTRDRSRLLQRSRTRSSRATATKTGDAVYVVAESYVTHASYAISCPTRPACALLCVCLGQFCVVPVGPGWLAGERRLTFDITKHSHCTAVRCHLASASTTALLPLRHHLRFPPVTSATPLLSKNLNSRDRKREIQVSWQRTFV